MFSCPFPPVDKETEKEKNLLKALQPKQPFSKMHLILLVFALVK